MGPDLQLEILELRFLGGNLLFVRFNFQRLDLPGHIVQRLADISKFTDRALRRFSI